MDQLQVFSHDEFGSVRTLLIGNEPYFVGKGVTDILGYSNSRDALSRHVAEEDRDAVGIHDAIGREQLTIFINESGLYSLILSSKLPAAKRFKHWITSEVLPAIRKHGVYAVDEVLNNPDLLLSALEALKQEREAARSLQETVDAQQELLTVMEPKALRQSARLPGSAAHHRHCQGLRLERAKDESFSARSRCPVQARKNMASVCCLCREGLHEKRNDPLYRPVRRHPSLSVHQMDAERPPDDLRADESRGI